MKKIILYILSPLFGTAPIQYCHAQFDHYGNATLKITTKDGGTDPNTGAFTFKDFPESNYVCQEVKDAAADYTDITFESGSLQGKDGSTRAITVTLRITPSGKGIFPLFGKSDTSPFANIGVMDDDSRFTLGKFDDQINPATNGSITITSYPSVGGDVKGTFQALLYGRLDTKNLGYYNVSGSFSVKRTK